MNSDLSIQKKRHLLTDAAGNKSPDLTGLKYLILHSKTLFHGFETVLIT